METDRLLEDLNREWKKIFPDGVSVTMVDWNGRDVFRFKSTSKGKDRKSFYWNKWADEDEIYARISVEGDGEKITLDGLEIPEDKRGQGYAKRIVFGFFEVFYAHEVREIYIYDVSEGFWTYLLGNKRFSKWNLEKSHNDIIITRKE